MNPRTVRPDRTRRRCGRFLALVLTATVLTACTPHNESVQNPCLTDARRGATGLPKIGLTPREVRQQQRC